MNTLEQIIQRQVEQAKELTNLPSPTLEQRIDELFDIMGDVNEGFNEPVVDLNFEDYSTVGNPYAEYEIESEIIEVEILDNLEIAYIETI
tara:strand:+ start:465 stop:734 length:270 start_codon:yes stop_codon:yes gene_type:complete